MREQPRCPEDRAKPSHPRLGPRRVFGLLLAGCLLFLGLQAWWVLTPGVAVRSGPRMVEIPAHRGFLDVARILGEAGVIRSPVGFTLLTLVRGSMRSLKAGEYQIPGGANTVAVLTMLEGGHVLQHNVVFREAPRWRNWPANSPPTAWPGRMTSCAPPGMLCSCGRSTYRLIPW